MLLRMLLFAIAIAVGSLHGTITDGNGALPGTTVTLTSPSYSAKAESDGKGQYAFDNVPPGVYDVTVELSGFFPTTRRVSIDAHDRVLPITMQYDPRLAADVVIDETPCVETPKSRWGMASCKDFKFDDALIAAVQHGDRSAMELLRRRYDEEPVYRERYRIGGALLGRVSDDGAIWNELAAHAANCIDFTDHPEKYEAYCSQRGCAPDEYEAVAWEALNAVSPDRRARPLLLRALASKDEPLVWAAVGGLAKQHDESALPEIEKALQRVPYATLQLEEFRSEAADALAKKVLSDELRSESPALRDE
jgi:hypothetical protein